MHTPLLILTLLILCISSAPHLAHAHGTRPDPLQVLRVTTNNTPEIVSTTFGIGFLNTQTTPNTPTTIRNAHHYACPNSWGNIELDTPLTVALPQGPVFIVGFDHLYTSDDALCTLTPILHPDTPFPFQVTQAIAAQNTVWGISNTPNSTRDSFEGHLWTWHPEQGFLTIKRFPNTRLSSIRYADHQIILAALSPNPSLFHLPTSPPHTLSEHPLPLQDNLPLQLSITRFVAPSRVWIKAQYVDQSTILYSNDLGSSLTPTLSAENDLQGPVPLCGGLIYSVDNTVTPDPLSPPFCDISFLRALTVTCVGFIEGTTYVCHNQNIQRILVEEGLTSTSPWFSIFDIQGLDPTCRRPPQLQQACQNEWREEGEIAGILTPSPTLEEEIKPPSDDDSPPSLKAAPTCTLPNRHHSPSPWDAGSFVLLVLILSTFSARRRRYARNIYTNTK